MHLYLYDFYLLLFLLINDNLNLKHVPSPESKEKISHKRLIFGEFDLFICGIPKKFINIFYNNLDYA